MFCSAHHGGRANQRGAGWDEEHVEHSHQGLRARPWCYCIPTVPMLHGHGNRGGQSAWPVRASDGQRWVQEMLWKGASLSGCHHCLTPSLPWCHLKDLRKVHSLKPFSLFVFALGPARERIFIQMHSAESRCAVGPENTLFAGVCRHLWARTSYRLGQYPSHLFVFIFVFLQIQGNALICVE